MENDSSSEINNGELNNIENHDILEDSTYLIYNMGQKEWSFGIAERLQEYAFKSSGLSWMYGNDAAYYSSINRKSNIVIGTLAAVSSIAIAGIFALVDNRSCSEPNVGFYVVTALSICFTVTIAILNRYQATMNFGYRISEFSEKSTKFGSLYRRIHNQFKTQPKNRQDALSLLDYVERRFEELDREKPFLRDKTVNEWGNYLTAPKPNINKDFIIAIPNDLSLHSTETVASRELVGDPLLNNCAIRIAAT